jgi:hypothetical protein
MIQSSVSFETTWILRILLLISVALTSACENEDIIKPQSQPEPSEPSIPVREWYPTPKHRQQPATYVPVPAAQQPSVMAPARQENTVQEPWTIPAQQPMYYVAPVPVYPGPPQVNQPQQPPVWAGQQPAASWPQPAAPQYQYTPRPWGDVSTAPTGQNPNASTGTWSQGGFVVTPWGTPIPGSSGVTNGPPVRPVPGSIYYAY